MRRLGHDPRQDVATLQWVGIAQDGTHLPLFCDKDSQGACKEKALAVECNLLKADEATELDTRLGFDTAMQPDRIRLHWNAEDCDPEKLGRNARTLPAMQADEIGRAHVCTPVTNVNIVRR